MRCDELDEDLLDTIGLYGEDKPTSETLIEQARQLLNTFLGKVGYFFPVQNTLAFFETLANRLSCSFFHQQIVAVT
jgi:hypothetical protein